MTDAQRDRLIESVTNLSDTSWDYYDGDNVWCLYCRATRPSPDADADLTWHDAQCIWKVAWELRGEGAFDPIPVDFGAPVPKPHDAIKLVDLGD